MRMVGSSAPILVLALAAGCACLACRSNPHEISAAKIEDALATTFANLVRVQQTTLGLPPVEASALRASARCHKVGPGNEVIGSGDWSCTVLWSFPGYKGPLLYSYDLTVTTDGCFTATTDEGHLGGPVLTTRDGVRVTNLLFAFDGCFDPG
jgi:ABC-2 type transport system permease protein